MKKLMVSFLIVLILTLSAGCGKPTAKLPSGTYIGDGEAAFLRLELTDDQHFIFTHLALSSWPPTGEYSVENERLTLMPDEAN